MKGKLMAVGPCNIERHDANTLTQQEFAARYAFGEPVILTYFDNSEFQKLCAKEALLEQYGNHTVTLSSANTYSYTKVPTVFKDYILNLLHPQRLEQLGNGCIGPPLNRVVQWCLETMFLFGDIDRTEWDELLREYLRPPWTVPGHRGELSFGVAGAGTGVPFHIHGPGFAEVIYGRKRWFLFAPDDKPDFDPDQSTLFWFLNNYPKLTEDQMPFECVLGPGEVLYFPDRWWHATLNVETAVFMSTFLSP